MDAKQLKTLIDLKQQHYEQAGERLAQLNAQRQQAQQQLEALDHYASDYRKSLQQRVGEGLTAARYSNFSRFIATLDQAVAQQSQAIAQLESQVMRQREQWRLEHRQLQAFQALQDRQIQREQQQQSRREQRQHDEIAARPSHIRL